MKKPMIKALAAAMAITMAFSTPLSANAAGLADLYQTNQDNNGGRSNEGTGVIGSDTGTGSGTGTIGATVDVDEDTVGNIVGIVVDKPELTVEYNKTENLSATVLVETVNTGDKSGNPTTIAVNAANIDLYSDLVVLNVNGRSITLEEVLSKHITWSYSKKYLEVKIPNTKKSNEVTVKGIAVTNGTTITASVKGVSTYKAEAKVKVKKYSTALTLTTPVELLVRHTVDMSKYLTRTPADTNDELTWKEYEAKTDGTLKTTKAATITNDGKLTLKTKGKTVYVIATSERGITSNRQKVDIKEGTPISKLTIDGSKSVKVDVSGETNGVAKAVETLKVKFDANGKKGLADNSGDDTTDYIKWEAKNKNLVNVDYDEDTCATQATITAVAPGKTTVTATATSGKKVTFSVTVSATLTGLTIEAIEGDVYAGQSVQLKVKPEPEVSKEKVLWKLDATGDALKQMKKVATDSSKGVLQANKKNETTPDVSVVAYSKAIRGGRSDVTSDPITITVKKSTITSISNFSPNKTELYVGKVYPSKTKSNLTVEGGEGPLYDMLSWSSNKPNVASVDAKGDITAKAAGTAKITAAGLVVKEKNGKETYSLTKRTITVTVKQPVESIQLNKADVTVNYDAKKVERGKDLGAVTLKVSKRLPKNADKKAKVTWSVTADDDNYVMNTTGEGNSFKVTVTKDAPLGAVIKVQALCMGVTTTSTITVCNKTAKVQLAADVKKNDSAIVGTDYNLDGKFVVVASDKGKEGYDSTYDEELTYSANNTNVIIIDGVVKPIKAGKTTITAKTASGKKATITLTISEKE